MKDRDRTLSSPLSDSDLTVRRHPATTRDLMAWDAADEYLLDYCANELDLKNGHSLVADDSFGALCCALAPFDVEMVHDSARAISSAKLNLKSNGLPKVNHFDWMDIPSEKRFDTVLMRMPKSLELLRDHCLRLRPHMTKGAILVTAAMDKYLSRKMLEVLSTCFGPTHTTLGQRKSRLAISLYDPIIVPEQMPLGSYRAEPFDFNVYNCPGVFSANRIDIGTRFFLRQFHHIPFTDFQHIADLGCGNGVLGLAAATENPEATIHFYDDSSIAIHSSRISTQKNFPASNNFHFHHCDGLADAAASNLELILCNPPFHLSQQQDTEVAERLFNDAYNALRPGGQLWVIGNRHLGYRLKMRQLFGNVHLVATNHKFVVLRSQRE